MMTVQKRGMVLAIAAAMSLAASVAAEAGVEIYGKARVSLDYINNNDPDPTHEDSTVSLGSNVSRLGFKGDEDLGNGLGLLWQLETQVDIDTGTAFQSPRNTYVGVSGGFGTVTGGRNETAYRIVTNRLDVFGDTKADYNAIVGNVGGSRTFDNRSNNVLSYISPNMSGLTVQAAYSLNRSSDDLPMTKSEAKRNIASVGGGYENGPLYVAAAYETLGYFAGRDAATAYKLGASWNFGQGTTVNGLFENADKGGAIGERAAWYVSAAHKMGDNTLKAAVAMADDLDGVNDSGATQYSLGAFHSLSKNTAVYALYTQVSNDATGTYGLWSGSQTIAGFADQSVSALSVGINHNFSSKYAPST